MTSTRDGRGLAMPSLSSSSSSASSSSSSSSPSLDSASSLRSSLLLSRLRINPLRLAAQHDLADCQRMHSRLLSAFPDDAEVTRARAHYGLLYRVEWEPATGAVVALAQSHTAPDWSRLPEGYLVAPAEVKPLAALYDGLREGMTLRFRLHANPTRRIRTSNQQEEARWRGKRVNLRTETEQLDWLRRKGEAHGFAVVDAQARRYRPPDLRTLGGVRDVYHGSSEGGRARGAHRGSVGGDVTGMRASTGMLTFGSVIFDGYLRVADPLRFREALEAGIGAGKAYGFGLLSIALAR